MALNRNNNFSDSVTSQSWSPQLCNAMFRKPPPLRVPGVTPVPECQKLLVHQADFKASVVETVAECFVALKGVF